MLVIVPGRHSLRAGLPCNSIAHIELTSLDSVCKEIDCGTVFWFTLIHLVQPLNAMGECVILAGRESEDA